MPTCFVRGGIGEVIIGSAKGVTEKVLKMEVVSPAFAWFWFTEIQRYKHR